MKNLTSAMAAHIQNNITSLATCWEITSAVTNETKRFTSNSRDLSISGDIFKAAEGYTPSQITSTLTLAVDNLDVKGFLSSEGFVREDLLSGIWDFAVVTIFLVDYNNPDTGQIKLRKGWIGEIQIVQEGFEAEIRGITDRLKTRFIEIYAPLCRADLGDSRCKVNLDPAVWLSSTPYTATISFSAEIGSQVKPTVSNGRFFKAVVGGVSAATEPTWDTVIGNTTIDGGVTWKAVQALTEQGSVTSVTGNRKFTDSSRIEVSEFWRNGKLTWLTGLNNKLSVEIKESLNSGVIELAQLMRFDITIGDTYKISAGCDKSLQLACRDKFDNTFNFRGEPHVPQKTQLAVTSV